MILLLFASGLAALIFGLVLLFRGFDQWMGNHSQPGEQHESDRERNVLRSVPHGPIDGGSAERDPNAQFLYASLHEERTYPYWW
jgi:hypothetical protein